MGMLSRIAGLVEIIFFVDYANCRFKGHSFPWGMA